MAEEGEGEVLPAVFAIEEAEMGEVFDRFGSEEGVGALRGGGEGSEGGSRGGVSDHQFVFTVGAACSLPP